MTPADRSFYAAQPVITVLAVIAFLVICLAGCGGGDAEEEDPDLRCVIDGLPRPPEACNQ